ncbi:MAG: response regulator [Bacteroidota bacterium]|nr:response regulator [Bacteroidota bacterium]
MKFFSGKSVRVQLVAVVFGTIILLVSSLGMFVHEFQKHLIIKKNTQAIEYKLLDYVDMFDIVVAEKKDRVNKQILVAHQIFYENYSSKLIENPNNMIEFDAVNQYTHDTIKVKVEQWIKDGTQLQYNYKIVDKIQSVGVQTVTVFQKIPQGYLCISTNVKKLNGERAVGTFIPNASVVIKTVEQGSTYSGRNYVVNDWYITNYEPIYVNGIIKGMLYVGEKEKDIQAIKDKFYKTSLLNSGYPFVLAADSKLSGLLTIHPKAEGENWKISKNEEKNNFYNKLLKTYKSNNFSNELDSIYSFKAKSAYFDDEVLVFFKYYKPFECFIGISVLKYDFVTKMMNFIKLLIISSIIFGLLISFFAISRFVKGKVSVITKFISSLKKLSKGEHVEQIKIKGKDEISQIAMVINNLLSEFNKNAEFARQIGENNLDIEYAPLSDKDILGNALLSMRNSLKQLLNEQNLNTWQQTSIVKINEVIRGEKDLSQLGSKLLSSLAEILEIQVAVVYIKDGNNSFKLTSSYAFKSRKTANQQFALGEGIIGQAAIEKKTILYNEVSQDHIFISSGLGEISPSSILVSPLVFKNEVIAVIELASIKAFPDFQIEFIEKISESIAIAFNSIQIHNEVQKLLEESTVQKEVLEKQKDELIHSEDKLLVQQEEMLQTNKELNIQTVALKESEKKLQNQQEELRVINEELEEKGKSLELQKNEISKRNTELEKARKNIEQKAKELEEASQYKSEFLANMSHELRTPLNSLLILSKDLADNTKGNLTDEDVESATIINQSGYDLLNLINEILDLSKVEAGKMDIVVDDMIIAEIENSIKRNFKHVISEKKIDLKINIEDDVPKMIKTDQKKVEQIIKNFMSNAIKFTNEGGVSVNFFIPSDNTNLSLSGLDPKKSIGISVKDSGIGIPKDKQSAIFEAFQQADGSTSRSYGGTGLGLSISRAFSILLGGELQLKSEENIGSTFTLFLPLEIEEGSVKLNSVTDKELTIQSFSEEEKNIKEGKKHIENPIKLENKNNPKIDDDRNNINDEDSLIIVIEDDLNFGKIVYNQCVENDFKCIVSESGEEGLKLIKKYMPDAIILDINLPGMNGWSVLQNIKEKPDIRHIPVHMMSVNNDNEIKANEHGAIGFLSKPVSRNKLNDVLSNLRKITDKALKDLLIVEDNKNMRKSIVKLIGKEGVNITEAGTGKTALEAMNSKIYDCVILDMGLPDMDGFELLEKLKNEQGNNVPPIVVYTGKELSQEENKKLQEYTDSIILKGVKSEARLLDETALFLHRVISDLPEKKQNIIKKLYDEENIFVNKKVLLTDDDMRNVFALTKKLKEKGMKIIKAENGQKAIEILKKEADIDIVLMDIMMPIMDGYETISKVRNELGNKKLPIIAMTAKAMKNDREKIIEVGASDYISKPIDIEKLFSLMRVWLYN